MEFHWGRTVGLIGTTRRKYRRIQKLWKTICFAVKLRFVIDNKKGIFFILVQGLNLLFYCHWSNQINANVSWNKCSSGLLPAAHGVWVPNLRMRLQMFPSPKLKLAQRIYLSIPMKINWFVILSLYTEKLLNSCRDYIVLEGSKHRSTTEMSPAVSNCLGCTGDTTICTVNRVGNM